MNMKKTLIALAVAASATVSGSAMAWEANGTGGSVNIGGTLIPAENVTPWEVKTGAAVNGLDADIRKGDTKVVIPVKNAIPVLGIRAVDVAGFKGVAGIAPQIDYKGAVDVSGFQQGVTTVRMDVLNNNGDKIGDLESPFFAGAERSYHSEDGSAKGHRSVYASSAGKAFYGGIDQSRLVYEEGVVRARVAAIDPEFTAKFDTYNSTFSSGSVETDFNEPGYIFNAFYGSGIESGKSIKITLDNPATGDAAIVWKATLPVTVSYQ